MASFHESSRIAVTRRRFQRLRDITQRDESIIAAPRESHENWRPRRIVLTGGPGSGKSTAASFLAREFVHDLWVLPEAATLLYRSGLPRGDRDMGVQIAQRAIFGVQRSLEQAHGLQHPERVQLCDRGTVDGAAYWPDADGFFGAMGTTRELELARYDVVIFLHTAAMLPAGYERDLEVRTEDRELAIDLDRRIFDLYRDHPRLLAIQSQGSFLDKLTSVRNAVATLVGTRPGVDAGSGAGTGPDTGAGSDTGAVRTAPVSALANLGAATHVLP